MIHRWQDVRKQRFTEEQIAASNKRIEAELKEMTMTRSLEFVMTILSDMSVVRDTKKPDDTYYWTSSFSVVGEDEAIEFESIHGGAHPEHVVFDLKHSRVVVPIDSVCVFYGWRKKAGTPLSG
jgi:hypothetical protein